MEFEESSLLPSILNYPVNLNEEDSISACSEPLTPLIMSQVTSADDFIKSSSSSVVNMTPIQDDSTMGSTFSQSQTKLSGGLPEEDSRSSYDSTFKTPLAVMVCGVAEDDSQSSLPKTPVTSMVVSTMNHEEDSQSSVVSQKSTGNKRRWDMVELTEKANVFPAENLFEYQWPVGTGKGTGEYYILQEQISEFLGVKSFKRKYPDLQRRPVEMDEKEYLKEKGVVTETQCDLGLTALRADEVIDLMVKDYFEKYQEYERILHEKEKRSISEKHRDYTAPRVEKSKMAEFIKKSVLSAAEWNSTFNRERKEERSACFDLQTNIVHYPMGGRAKAEAVESNSNIYPVSLIPGQFQEFYKRYNEAELKYLPLNTVLYGPVKQIQPLDLNSISDGSQSDSDDSSCSGSSSESERDGSGDSSAPREKVQSVTPIVEITPVSVNRSKRKTPVKRKTLTGIPTLLLPPPTPLIGAQCRLCDQDLESLKDSFQCTTCQKFAHFRCLHFSKEMSDSVRKYAWQCMNCKTCILCRDATDEASMMFCDKCDRGYHTFCVGLKSIPLGSWFCGLCGQCSGCNNSRPSGPDATKAQWWHHYSKTNSGEQILKQSLCQTCHSKTNGESNGVEDKRAVRLQLRMKRSK